MFENIFSSMISFYPLYVLLKHPKLILKLLINALKFTQMKLIPSVS